MNHTRAFHGATLLNSGQVLIAGGVDENGHSVTAELFDPTTGEFTMTSGNMNNADDKLPTLLNDGTVLFIGSANGSTVNSLWLKSGYVVAENGRA
jgi:hypothetical protein